MDILNYNCDKWFVFISFFIDLNYIFIQVLKSHNKTVLVKCELAYTIGFVEAL